MMTEAIRHPFEAGEQYRNEDGVYTVVRLEEPDMVIQYEDGRTLRSSIRMQARIWERLQHEKEIAAKQAATKKAAKRRGGSRSRAAYGRDFDSLQETDFRRDVTGTSWRRRSELAGLLAARLADLSGEVFESHAVYHRPEVYIVQPEYWKSERSLHAAKFFFRLAEQGAWYGFVIEKSDEAMDASWDWQRFTAALAEDKTLQARTLIAMEHCNLQWEIYPDGADIAEPAPQIVIAEQDSIFLQKEGESERTPIDWDGLISLLEAIPADAWCGLYLATHMDKVRAIELEEELAQEAASVYQALLPLYAASVEK